MDKDPKKLEPDTGIIALNLIEKKDLQATLLWHVYGELEEVIEEDLRQVAEGVMCLIANQMDDLIQIGSNVEEGRRREPFKNAGNVIPFPTTQTKH